MNNSSFRKPVLLLDEQRCKNNIENMCRRAATLGCTLRPHFKTHQSLEIGSWFKDAGVTGITVSSTGMALFFSQDGWDDMTIGFPFFPAMIPDLKILETRCRLRLFVNDPSHLELLNKELEHPFQFFIEIDPGYGRSGIHYKNTAKIDTLMQAAAGNGTGTFYGFYVHDGRTYQAKGKGQIREAITPSLSILGDLKKNYPQAVISLGDTPSSSVLDPGDFEDIDEITPGNFVFYDWMQVNIGSCSLDEVCLYAVLPVAQFMKEEQRAMVHGGAVHLSKDFITDHGTPTFGQRIHYSPEQITPDNGCYISAVSQEHGTLSGVNELPGDEAVWICPVHSCLTANLHNHYLTTTGKRIEKRVLS